MNNKQQFHVYGIPRTILPPDLMVLVFFLWGIIERLCIQGSHTHTHTDKMQELKHAIQDETATIYQELSCRYFTVL
jgi:hypothetical protein